MEYLYERGVMLDGTAATYSASGGPSCSTCGESGEWAVRVEAPPLRPTRERVEPAKREQVLLPCGHVQ